MKKLFLGVVLAALTFSSCSKSIQEQAEQLVKESAIAEYNIESSYEMVSVEVDSIFAPLDNPAIYEETLNFKKILKADEAKLKALGPDAFNLNNLPAEAKEIMLHFADEEIAYMDRLEKLINMEHEFIGYKVTHKFNAKDDNGEINNFDRIYILDKDLSKVEYNYPMDEYTKIMKQTVYTKERIVEARKHLNAEREQILNTEVKK